MTAQPAPRQSTALLFGAFLLSILVGCGGNGGGSVSGPSPEAAPKRKWTVLVYMNAANNLGPYSTQDINEMERVAQSPDVNVIVQWKTPMPANGMPFQGVGRFQVQPDLTNDLKSKLLQKLPDATDMGNWQTLRSFISWGKANFPANRYAVVVWNHGRGWRETSPDGYQTEGVSYDDLTGNHIKTWQLPSAIGLNGADILAFDASLMQQLEVAYEVRRGAQYVVGSQESPPGEGYPYHRVLARFRDFPDASTRSLSKAFVDAMINETSYANAKITQSSIETAKLEALGKSMTKLANALVANRVAATPAIRKARDTSQAYSDNGSRQYRDLVGVLDVLAAQGPTAVRTAAAEARTSAKAAIAFNARNWRSPKSNGLAIEFCTANLFTPVAMDYANLLYARETSWDNFLKVAP